MAPTARTQTFAVSLAVHLALAGVLALGGRKILAPRDVERTIEIEVLPDDIDEPDPKTPSLLEETPTIPTVRRPERVPERVVPKLTDKARAFQADAPIEDGEHEAPDDAEAIAAPMSPMVFSMNETVGGGSGLEYSATTSGSLSLPPPGPAGGAMGASYAPGARNLKVAKDWQITRQPMPTNDASFEPSYPPLAKRQGREARVVVELDIDPQGAVRDARVIEGPTEHGFRESALEYVRKLHFDPARAGAHAVASRIEWTVHFYVRN